MRGINYERYMVVHPKKGGHVLMDISSAGTGVSVSFDVADKYHYLYGEGYTVYNNSEGVSLSKEGECCLVFLEGGWGARISKKDAREAWNMLVEFGFEE
jgi:hypothetical protein